MVPSISYQVNPLFIINENMSYRNENSSNGKKTVHLKIYIYAIGLISTLAVYAFLIVW